LSDSAVTVDIPRRAFSPAVGFGHKP